MDSEPLAELYKKLKSLYLHGEKLLLNKSNVDAVRELTRDINKAYETLMAKFADSPSESKIPDSEIGAKDIEKEKDDYDRHVDFWLSTFQSQLTNAPDLSQLFFGKGPGSILSTQTHSSTSSSRSEKRKSLVKFKLAAQASKHENERVYETRYRAKVRAEEAKRKAQEQRDKALREAEQEFLRAEEEANRQLREVEVESEFSLRERQRELELAETEFNAWEETEDVLVLQVDDSTQQATSSSYAVPTTQHSEDAEALETPVPVGSSNAKSIPIQRPASAPVQQKTISDNVMPHSALRPASCSQNGTELPSSLAIHSMHADRGQATELQTSKRPIVGERKMDSPAMQIPPDFASKESRHVVAPSQAVGNGTNPYAPHFYPTGTSAHTPQAKPDIYIPLAGMPEYPRSSYDHRPQMAYSAQEYYDRPLPRIEIKKFDGDPMNYWSFIRNYSAYVGRRCYSDDYRRQFLMQSLEPKIRDRYEHYQIMPPTKGFQGAWSQLYEDYGHPHVISRSCEERLKAFPKLKEFDTEGLSDLSILLNRCCTCLENSPSYSTLDSMDIMLSVCKRLPDDLRYQWVKESVKIESTTGQRAKFVDLTKFVCEQRRVLDSMFGRAVYKTPRLKPLPTTKSFTPKRERCLATFNSSFKPTNKNRQEVGFKKDRQKERYQPACSLCSGAHNLFKCQTFQNLSFDDRMKHVREKVLCFKCLKGNHTSRECRSNTQCEVEGCTGTLHHTLLHKQKVKPATSEESNENTNTVCSTVSSNSLSAVFLNVVPVSVTYNQKRVCTYAFLDQGSTATFCEKSLSTLLEVDGTPKQVTVQTLTTPKTLDTISFSLEIQSLEEASDSILLREVIVVDEIPVKPNPIPDSRFLRKHHGRSDVTLPRIDNGTVQLLIGANVPAAFRIEMIRSGADGCPDLIRSPLGWSLFGPSNNNCGYSNASCNFVSIQTTEDENVLSMFLNDESDLNPVTADDEIDNLSVISSLSAEDRRTYGLMNDSVKFVDGHYELPLPWRHDHQELPDNRTMAVKRLGGLKRRLLTDVSLKDRYNQQMQILLDKGYAEPVPNDEVETQKRTWYIPHHPVLNPKKPDKLRIVYDCAATYAGVSLNQVLMQGPDLVNSLVGVLTRFRKESIAIVADIEAMFHQVRVAPRDRDCLRFLWWPGGDMSKQAIPHRMCVHLFGATSSPSCAAFCLRKAATQFGSNFDPRVAATIEQNFYVDDLLCTAANPSDGLQLISDLTKLLSQAGFHLTKWLSNSQAVIDQIPEEERSKSLQVCSFADNLDERILGVNWSVQSDEFKFNIKLPMKPRTRRGFLSTMNSLFDPLGFVNPVVLEARMIYRVLCQQELEWDEPIMDPEMKRWEKWLSSLLQLQNVAIPRFIGIHEPRAVERCQLHYFADASKHAFGAVCYLRMQESPESIRCVLMMAKSRLAPKSEESIPRLELMAAVTAVNMDLTLKKELGLPNLRPSIFWSDSSIVLQSLRNEHKRFPLFVSRRLHFISRNTCVDNWKHVSTKDNPADFVSRGATADTLLKSNLWFTGPPFLLQNSELWPSRFEKQAMLPKDIADFDRTPVASFAIQLEMHPMDRLISYFSCWFKLRRAAAWLSRVKTCLYQQIKGERKIKLNSPMTVKEMRKAGDDIIKYEQSIHFAQWITGLSQETPTELSKVSKSPVAKLNPILCEGILRVGGRLDKAPIEFSAKHPVILPNVSNLTELIIQAHHEITGHSGLNITLNSLSQQFWIIKAVSAVKRILGKCIPCKLRDSKAEVQLMQELPPSRLQAETYPFAYTGVDYFGPLSVRQGRSDLKRYGCLFTCLTTRSIHLELAADLSTDSFINVMRRFVSRRGPILHLFSDNGTNFVGAERILRESIQNWNRQKLNSFFLQKEIQWTFNPPAASHMGGAWERMIKSVRRILTALSRERTLSEDQLHTLLLEAEAILNSRPLTPVTLDADGITPLTPNHLLRVNDLANMPPTVTEKKDCYAKRRWRHVQYLADQFWKRWSREYLRTIISRQKWHYKRRNFEVGDVVLLTDDSIPRAQWSLGRVSTVYPDRHGIVRTVVVKTRGSELTRPIHKLCLIIPTDENKDEDVADQCADDDACQPPEEDADQCVKEDGGDHAKICQ